MPSNISSEKSAAAGSAIREKVNVRAHELAALAGRIPPQVCQADYEQAKRDVMGESARERKDSA